MRDIRHHARRMKTMIGIVGLVLGAALLVVIGIAKLASASLGY